MMLSVDDLLPETDDDGFYRRYLETCRRLGVEPASRERVRELVEGWNRVILDGESDGKTMK